MAVIHKSSATRTYKLIKRSHTNIWIDIPSFMATCPFPSYDIGYFISISFRDTIIHVLTELCIKWVSIQYIFLGVVKLHDMPRLLIFLEPKSGQYARKTNLIFIQYIKMTTKNRYQCRLRANAQWHVIFYISVSPDQYSRMQNHVWIFPLLITNDE